MVLWITATQVAFGSDVLAYRLQDFFGEPVSQQPRPQLFMSCIDPLVGDVFSEVMQHVAIVMQQATEDQCIRFAVLRGKLGGLQSVLLFADTFTVVTLSAFAKDAKNLCHHEVCSCCLGISHGALLSLFTTDRF